MIYKKWWFWLFVLIAFMVAMGFIQYLLALRTAEKLIAESQNGTDTASKQISSNVN